MILLLLLLFCLVDLMSIYLGSIVTNISMTAIIMLMYSGLMVKLANHNNLQLQNSNLVTYNNLFFISFFLIFITVIVNFFMGFEINDVNKILALRNYLFFIPAIYIGIYDKSLFSKQSFRILTFVLFLLLIISAIQSFQSTYVEDYSNVIFAAKEHHWHSFHEHTYFMASSVFNSGKKYSYFLLFTGLFLLSISSLRNKSKNLSSLIIVLITISLMLTGSRAVLIIFLGVLILYLLFFKKNLLLNILMFLFLISIIGLVGYTIFSSIYFNAVNRLDYLTSFTEIEDYVERLYEFFNLSIFYSNFSFLGYDFGAHGQERELKNIFTSNNDIKLQSETYIYGNPQTTVFEYPIKDGGLTKIAADTGFFGLIFILFHYCLILILSLKGLIFSKIKNSKLMFFVSIMPICWLILFLKTHVFHSNTFTHLIFYISVGLLIKIFIELDSKKSQIK